MRDPLQAQSAVVQQTDIDVITGHCLVSDRPWSTISSTIRSVATGTHIQYRDLIGQLLLVSSSD